MFLGIGATSSVTQTAGSPAAGVSAAPNALVVLVKMNASHPGGDGSLQKRQRAEDIDIDEIPLAVRGDVRLVQGRRVDDGAHARHARADEIPIADRADADR